MSMDTNKGYTDDRMYENQNSPNFTQVYSIRNIPYFLIKTFPRQRETIVLELQL